MKWGIKYDRNMHASTYTAIAETYDICTIYRVQDGDHHISVPPSCGCCNKGNATQAQNDLTWCN